MIIALMITSVLGSGQAASQAAYVHLKCDGASSGGENISLIVRIGEGHIQFLENGEWRFFNFRRANEVTHSINAQYYSTEDARENNASRFSINRIDGTFVHFLNRPTFRDVESRGTCTRIDDPVGNQLF
jgi:hypothetical protein